MLLTNSSLTKGQDCTCSRVKSPVRACSTNSGTSS
jgi:hypothetical protein